MARLGIYVAQHALNVTGNNISNINTEGYTRQQLDQTSMYYGAADRYQGRFDIRENGGVLAQGVNQLRDQYLDIRYRNEETRVGAAEQKLSGLRQLGDIFDEVAKGEDGDGVLEARFNDFIQQIENLHKPENSNKDDMDSIVRSAAEALTTQFHDYAKQLETLKQNMTAQFRQEIDSVNATLTKIRDLNESIRRTQVFGGSALTRKDERNLLIDDLSKQIGIHVTYEMEDLGDGVEVEKLKITTAGDPSRTLIDGIYGTQLTILNENNYDLALGELVSKTGKLMPNQPNPTEKMLSDVEVTTVAEKASVFKLSDFKKDGMTDDEAKAAAQAAVTEMVERLNGDTKYTLGDDGKNYFYDVDPPISDGSSATEWRIHQHEVGKGDAGVYVKLIENPQARLSDTELAGGLQAMREMMTEAGEYTKANDPKLNDKTDPAYDPLHYDPDAGSKRGIPYYQKALDTLANTFARIVNEANIMQDKEIYQNTDGAFVTGTDTSTGEEAYLPKYGFEKYFETDSSGKYIVDPEDTGTPKHLKVKEEYQKYMGSALFSNNSNGNEMTNITAANISVAADWESGAHRMLRSKDPNADEQSTKQDNLDHIITLLTSKQKFTTELNSSGSGSNGGSMYFEGTFQEMLTDTIAGTLAKDENITKTMLDNYNTTADELYVDRDAIMGVDLNDEAMNMMQYQKAYSAACRLMTTFDGMLEKLINGTAV